MVRPLIPAYLKVDEVDNPIKKAIRREMDEMRRVRRGRGVLSVGILTRVSFYWYLQDK